MNQQLDIDLYHYHIWVYAAEQTWSKAPLSHFYGPCPVAPNGYTPHDEEELLGPASVAAFVCFFCFVFNCHLQTRPAVSYFHYVICVSLNLSIFKTTLLILWSSRFCRCFLFCQSGL